jgi:hypothetical protein
MTIAFPRAAIAVIGQSLHFFATVFADKNPYFTFLNLHPKKRRFLDFAKRTYLRFHTVTVIF